MPLVVALHHVGRNSDARELLNCLNSRLRAVRLAGPRDPYGIEKAQILAVSGKPDQAVQTLNATIRSGWYEPSVRLGDFPAFDVLANRPDFLSMQAQLDRWIARERQESRTPNPPSQH